MCMVCLACYEGAHAPAFPLPPAFISSHRITRAYEDRAGLGKSTHSIWACSPLSPATGADGVPAEVQLGSPWHRLSRLTGFAPASFPRRTAALFTSATSPDKWPSLCRCSSRYLQFEPSPPELINLIN